MVDLGWPLSRFRRLSLSPWVIGAWPVVPIEPVGAVPVPWENEGGA